MGVIHFTPIIRILFISIITASRTEAAEKYWVCREEIRRDIWFGILPCDSTSFCLSLFHFVFLLVCNQYYLYQFVLL